MKKRILICITCVAVAGTFVHAQDTSISNDQFSTAVEFVLPPLPPAPPEPPMFPVAPPPPPAVDQLPVPPAPPLPPAPPTATPAPPASCKDYTQDITTIVNGNGFEATVIKIKETDVVILGKDGKKQKIKLSTWGADRKYFEKKYGHLPPPTPPVEVRNS
ncbi:MAG: hypothetical protein ABIO04_14040 [Ferruginibacter sp.]